MARDSLNKEDALNRINSQMSLKEKLGRGGRKISMLPILLTKPHKKKIAIQFQHTEKQLEKYNSKSYLQGGTMKKFKALIKLCIFLLVIFIGFNYLNKTIITPPQNYVSFKLPRVYTHLF